MLLTFAPAAMYSYFVFVEKYDYIIL